MFEQELIQRSLVSEWVSAGLLSVVLVGRDISVQVEEKLFPSSLRFTNPFLILVLALGGQAVGVLSLPSCSLCWLSFSSCTTCLVLGLLWVSFRITASALVSTCDSQNY